MENNQPRRSVEISACELRRQRSTDEIIKYQCTLAELCTRAIRALTFYFRLMQTPIRSSFCGQPCHRSSMSRKAQKVFQSVLIIVAQIWDVIRRMIVYAFKTYEKASQPVAPGTIISVTVTMLGVLDCYFALHRGRALAKPVTPRPDPALDYAMESFGIVRVLAGLQVLKANAVVTVK
ncbi:hypothetical protein XU18_1423 [Perkinsela sp. CCAP 1560/4]|nr:hypothetical protein XU18_1423 [Perkinsela sp. CCAP 1560/4]|eukprot:KNH07991.1 hypothetical protein XU18_1423 [Perkinsela sp. CCAP 1560/4]